MGCHGNTIIPYAAGKHFWLPTTNPLPQTDRQTDARQPVLTEEDNYLDMTSIILIGVSTV